MDDRSWRLGNVVLDYFVEVVGQCVTPRVDVDDGVENAYIYGLFYPSPDPVLFVV